MPPRTKSSQSWLKEHFKDPYVKKSWADGYRSRAAYKLLEIQKKDRILKQGMKVVDLGAAPGSWAQIAANLIGKNGVLVGLDILPIEPMANATFIQGDFKDEAVYQQLTDLLKAEKVDVVLSDMAPNMSGNKDVDQYQAMYLIELAVDFSRQNLKVGGSLLMKVFSGVGFDDLIKQMRQEYEKVVIRKPDASRDRSREIYVLGLGFRG
ncbi:MAG: 23S rRNA (uridine(2552)-2'-O)-methyltransferase RlmE [Gammaproteobacteria bacterium]|nr:23S rRNA (uridine(2552)-2'-O)-methyltransferase RlmE [Gammaproteobacteria bacterium]